MSNHTELHVTVEMSDDFEPGARTQAALAELVEALHSDHGDDDVGGFGELPRIRSFSFSLTPQTGGLDASPMKWKMASFDGKANDVVTEEPTT